VKSLASNNYKTNELGVKDLSPMKIDHSHQPVNREDFEYDYQSADKNPKIIENSIQSYSKGIARHLVSTQ